MLEPADLTVQILDLVEQLLGRVRRTGRQELETLAQEGAALRVEEVAHLQIVEGVLGQGGVNAILELRALPDEHHARARKVALVAQLAWGNPDRREGAVALELIERSGKSGVYAGVGSCGAAESLPAGLVGTSDIDNSLARA